MPNWCENKLVIKGDPEVLAMIVHNHVRVVNGEKCLDFNTIIPEPRTREECPAEYINSQEEIEEALMFADKTGVDPNMVWFDWYKWHNFYWGTKWNSCDTMCPEPIDIVDNSINEVEIWFSTAWGPATEAMYKLIDMYIDDVDNIYCAFFESGMFFGGTIGDEWTEYEDEDTLLDFAVEEEFIDRETANEWFGCDEDDEK